MDDPGHHSFKSLGVPYLCPCPDNVAAASFFVILQLNVFLLFFSHFLSSDSVQSLLMHHRIRIFLLLCLLLFPFFFLAHQFFHINFLFLVILNHDSSPFHLLSFLGYFLLLVRLTFLNISSFGSPCSSTF